MNKRDYMIEIFQDTEKWCKENKTLAAANEADILVLGTFGCGAFQNKPEIVARAYKEIIQEFPERFTRIEFAVYCPPRDTKNYEVFRRTFEFF